jgi:hypothetical protein
VAIGVNWKEVWAPVWGTVWDQGGGGGGETPIGINWAPIWKQVWGPVWAQEASAPVEWELETPSIVPLYAQLGVIGSDFTFATAPPPAPAPQPPSGKNRYTKILTPVIRRDGPALDMAGLSELVDANDEGRQMVEAAQMLLMCLEAGVFNG